MMSTTTGKLFPARVKGSSEEVATVNGQPRKIRRFDIVSDKPEVVWLDERDITVAFATEDNGSRVEFILTRIGNGAAGSSFVRLDKLPPGTPANDP